MFIIMLAAYHKRIINLLFELSLLNHKIISNIHALNCWNFRNSNDLAYFDISNQAAKERNQVLILEPNIMKSNQSNQL